MPPYSGSTFTECPFELRFTKPSVAYVIGGNANVFGHVLLCFGPEVGYMHVDALYAYPKLIPAGRFNDYLTENKKTLFYRYEITDLTKQIEALAEAERLRTTKWLWAVVPHNCVAFAEQILGKGGSKWTSKTNLPVFSAFGDFVTSAW